jgi:hypothetical protein
VLIPKISLTSLLRHVQSEAGNGSVQLTNYAKAGRLLVAVISRQAQLASIQPLFRALGGL